MARRVRGLAGGAAGLGMRATARGLEGEAPTGRPWRGAAAEPRRACAASVLCALHVQPRPLEAVDAVRRARKAGASSDGEALQRLERSPAWGGTVLAPQSQLLGGGAVGPRTLAMAPRVVQQLGAVGAPGWGPLCVTDGGKA